MTDSRLVWFLALPEQRNVRFWHKAEMPLTPVNVRFQG
jgi:hypothetical protein